MAIHKLKDWQGWLDGLRTSVMKAGATAITTYLTAFITTNGLAAAAGPDVAWFQKCGHEPKDRTGGARVSIRIARPLFGGAIRPEQTIAGRSDADEKKPVDTNADSAKGSGK